MLAIVIEPHRFLSEWWLLRARDIDRHPDRVPVLDILHKPTSVLFVAQQYLASVLHGNGEGRVRLLWLYQNFETFAAFCSERPAQVREFRRLLLVMAVSIYKRHTRTFDEWDVIILQFVDGRVSESEKDTLGKAWDELRWCCARPGIARQLRKHGVTSTMLRESPLWQQFLLQWARVLSMLVADLEWRHGRNRGRSDSNGKTVLPNFVAEAILAEAKLLHAARDSFAGKELNRLLALPGNDQGNDEAVVHSDDPKKMTLRAQTPEELHKWEWLRQQKALSLPCNPTDKQVWESWRRAFAELPPERRATYESRAEQSKLIASTNRPEKKRQKIEACRAIEPMANGVQRIDAHAVGPTWAHFFSPCTCSTNNLGNLNVSDFINASGVHATAKHPMLDSAVNGSQKKSCDNFAKSVGFAKPANTDDTFPDTVEYQSCCGGVCRTTSSNRQVQLYDHVLEAFAAYAGKIGVGRKLSSEDLVLAIEVYGPAVGGDGSVLSAVWFFDLREAHGAVGSSKAGSRETNTYTIIIINIIVIMCSILCLIIILLLVLSAIVAHTRQNTCT